MRRHWNKVLPAVFVIMFLLTRWPGLMPVNFSAAYALAFCAGVYFPRRFAWCLPLGALAISDFGLNIYYYFAFKIDAFSPAQLFNYVSYALLIWLGMRFNSGTSLLKLVGGGIFGAFLFYLITNTTAWFLNPFRNAEYTRNLTGWIIALTRGTAGYPETWEFFRNTLLSGGLFTGLFVGAMKLGEMAEEADSTEEQAEARSKGAEARAQ